MIPADLHVHSAFSADSETPMEDSIEEALKKGLSYICFTDHIDYDYPVDDLVFDFDLPAYFDALDRLKEKYRGRIEILTGVELGMQKHLGPRYEELVKARPFDFVAASQHLVNNMDPYYPETFACRHDREVFGDYFRETLEDIRLFEDFDALTHLDYIVRYGKEERTYALEDYREVIDEILKILIRRDKALEVNTAGIRKRLGDPNPKREVIRRYRELGGRLITVGSDSHKAYSIGYGYEETFRILKDCGFREMAVYKNRRPQLVPI